MTVGEARKKIGAVEFWRWIIDIEEQWKEQTADHWYAAQIAFRVYMLEWRVAHLLDKNAKPPDFQIKDFLLDFDTSGVPQHTDPIKRLEARKAKIEASKRAWLGWLNVNPDKPGRKRKKPRRARPLPPDVARRTREFHEMKRRQADGRREAGGPPHG
jgi:hypothetical protein